MKFMVFIYVSVIFTLAYSEKQDYSPTQYGVEGKPVSLPCAHPSAANYLKWVFHGNGSEFNIDAAQVFPGKMPSVFFPFNAPPGRSELDGGTLRINQILVADEGDYWCEISSAGVATTKSSIYPVHVYVTPEEPRVASLSSNTLTEHKNSTVARCTSHGGKPGAKITWMNGSIPLTSSSEITYRVNSFKNYLTDADVDLRIDNPTRYDHGRLFSCIIEHPAYGDEKKVLNYTINVMYHPINIKVWANLTSLHVFCEAESYPNSTYHWTMPGGLTGFTGPSLYVENLYDLPGNERFECVASNGVPPNATVRVQVDDLLYPDGKPGWLGLDWWIWGTILGGAFALILIIIATVCCCRSRRKASKEEKGAKNTAPVKRSNLKNVECHRTPQHPTSLRVDMNYRTPDGREDSFDSPSPVNEHKQALIDGVFDGSHCDYPNGYAKHSRENAHAENRKSMHSSREQLDDVARHIQTLNKSWDQLSKSRQALNDTQDELQQVPLNRIQNHSYSHGRTDRSSEYYPQYDDRSQDQHDRRARQLLPAYDYDGQDGAYDGRDQSYRNRHDGGDQGYYADQRPNQSYDTYRDNRYSDGYRDGHDRGGGYNDYRQDSRYDDGSYDYRDGRRDYYEDDRYTQHDR